MFMFNLYKIFEKRILTTKVTKIIEKQKKKVTEDETYKIKLCQYFPCDSNTNKNRHTSSS